MKIEVEVPDELGPFASDLSFFFELMVRKLHINRHKGFAEGDCLDVLIDGIHRELGELKKAFENESQFNMSMEAVDVANFSFLTALKLWEMTVVDYKSKQAKFRSTNPALVHRDRGK